MPRHFEEKKLPFSCDQLYALVADIESYPQFLPWCQGARILERRPDGVTAELSVGLKALREGFISKVTFEPPKRIVVTYEKGPLSRLATTWGFEPIDQANCNVTFFVDFAIRSPLLGAVMAAFFDKAFRQMVGAFESRAQALYGEKNNDAH